MKYCPKCGGSLPDGASFCMECGEDVRTVTAEVVSDKKDTRPRLHILAIVGAALSFLGLPGAIISGIALKNATHDRFKVPLRPVAVAGLIVGICFTVFWTLYIALVGTALGVLISRMIEEMRHYVR